MVHLQILLKPVKLGLGPSGLNGTIDTLNGGDRLELVDLDRGGGMVGRRDSRGGSIGGRDGRKESLGEISTESI